MAGRNIPELAYPGFYAKLYAISLQSFLSLAIFNDRYSSEISIQRVVQASLIRGYRIVFPFSRLAKIIFRKGVRRAASVSITPVSNSAYRYVAIPFRVDRVTRMVTLSV